MRLIYAFLTSLCLLTFSNSVWAQLPGNPWAPHPNDGYFGDNVGNGTEGAITNAPIYQNNEGGGQIIPVDPWARARDRSGIKTWRGSGQHGKLNYIGEATTFSSTAGGGEEMIAPEVNRHNMIVMLEHLRNMGYKIPTSYDQKIKDLPKNYTLYMHQSMSDLNSGTDPFSTSFKNMINIMENYSGLDFNNLIFNTLDILGTD